MVRVTTDTWADVRGADLFSASARRIVDYLNAHTPMTDWSVSRIAGNEQVHLHVHDEGTTGTLQDEGQPVARGDESDDSVEEFLESGRQFGKVVLKVGDW